MCPGPQAASLSPALDGVSPGPPPAPRWGGGQDGVSPGPPPAPCCGGHGAPFRPEHTSACVCAQSCPTLCDPLDRTRQAPLSLGFSRQEHCSRLLCPSPGDLPNPGIEPTSPEYPALAGGFFTTSIPWEAQIPVKESESEVSLLYLTLCDPMDCNPPSSSVHGILQARILEWAAISFSRGSSRPRDRTRVSCSADRHFTV